MQFEHSDTMSRTTVWDRDNYSVDLEVRENHPFLHFRIHKWSVSTYKELQLALREFRYFLSCVGYPYVFGAIEGEDKKQEKLFGMFGAEVISKENGVTVFVLTTDLYQEEEQE